MSVDQSKLDAFVDQVVTDLSASYVGVMVSLGDKLGLYKVMAGAGPLTSHEVAARANCSERYVREWLNGQVAGRYLDYHPASQTYELTPEQAMVLADETSPVFMPSAWQVPASMWFDEDKAIEAFQTGKGISWSDHDARMSCGSAAFYRNAYRDSLVDSWLPALDGVVETLERGAKVADIGCGHGHSTMIMAEAFPNSQFSGFDLDAASIDIARTMAKNSAVADRVTFDIASANSYPQDDYDLICFFDCLHDMGDPIAVAAHAAGAINDTGTVMLVEPFANDAVEENIGAIGRLFYAASSTICCANAVHDGGSLVLGAQAGAARLCDVLANAGLGQTRVALQTPFNLILQAKL